MLSIEHLTKTYGEKKAVDDLSLHIAPGEIYGFIGHNGAGKTTTLKAAVGILDFDAGEISIGGVSMKKDPLACKKQLAYIPDNPDLYDFMSGVKYLNFIADIFGVGAAERQERIHKYAELFELTNDLGQPISAYSHGMKQKLALCCALVHNPEVLFLDEPTTGVDAVSRKEFWAMLKKIKDRGVTIVVSTPYMDEASLCDRIAMILDGSVIGLGSPAEIISRYPNRIYSVSGGNMFQTLGALRGVRGVLDCSSFGSACHVSVTDDGPDETGLAEALRSAGIEGCDVRRMTPGIEDCFIRLSSSAAEGSSGAE